MALEAMLLAEERAPPNQEEQIREAFFGSERNEVNPAFERETAQASEENANAEEMEMEFSR